MVSLAMIAVEANETSTDLVVEALASHSLVVDDLVVEALASYSTVLDSLASANSYRRYTELPKTV